MIGLAEDDLEAAVQVFFVRKGRVVGRRGFVIDKVEALDRSQLVGNILEGLYYDEPAARLPEGRAVLRPARRPRPVRDVARPSSGPTRRSTGASGRPGADPGAAAGRQARTAGHRHPQRRGGVRPPPAAAGQRHQRPLEGAGGAAGRPGPADRAPAHRVLRQLPPGRHRLRQLDGGVRGRPAGQGPVPAVPAAQRARQRRLRRHGGGPHPPPDELPGGPRPAARRAGPLPVPAPAAHGRRRQGPAGRGHPGAGGAGPGRGDPGLPRWPRSSRRCTCPARATRSACPAAPRRCTCCSGCGTSRTASPSPTSASCATSG